MCDVLKWKMVTGNFPNFRLVKCPEERRSINRIPRMMGAAISDAYRNTQLLIYPLLTFSQYNISIQIFFHYELDIHPVDSTIGRRWPGSSRLRGEDVFFTLHVTPHLPAEA